MMKTIFLVFLTATVGLFFGFADRYGALDAFQLCAVPIILTFIVGKDLLCANPNQSPDLNDIVLR